LVQGFLDRGYWVVANSRYIKPHASADLLAVAGDIADPAVTGRVIGGAVGKFGRVDTLVNNAGVFISKPFTEHTLHTITSCDSPTLTRIRRPSCTDRVC
jgi:NAD(P)-dependent dehydrogenase (short-subunit alcohol dehydrogenase family)